MRRGEWARWRKGCGVKEQRCRATAVHREKPSSLVPLRPRRCAAAPLRFIPLGEGGLSFELTPLVSSYLLAWFAAG